MFDHILKEYLFWGGWLIGGLAVAFYAVLGVNDWRTVTTESCVECGKSFSHRTTTRAFYCSKTCGDNYWKKHRGGLEDFDYEDPAQGGPADGTW